jgi:hypothetical protein
MGTWVEREGVGMDGVGMSCRFLFLFLFLFFRFPFCSSSVLIRSKKATAGLVATWRNGGLSMWGCFDR